MGNRAQQVAKTLQDVYDTNPSNKIGWFSEAIEFYIKTDAKNILNWHEMQNAEHMKSYNDLAQGYDQSKFAENSVTKGFITHSCNGYFLDQIKEHGLGSNVARDDELGNEMDYLEQFFGGHAYAKDYARPDVPQFYATGPGAQSMYYAMQQSPERLFLGILRQEREDALPIIVGESRVDYAIRVIEKKLSVMNIEDVAGQQIMKTARSLFDKLLTQDPAILFVPISEVENGRVSMGGGIGIGDYTGQGLSEEERINKYPTVKKHIEYETRHSTNDIFQNDTGGFMNGGNSSNLDNMAIYNMVVPYEKMGVLRVKSAFDVQQELAVKQGLLNGDEMPYFASDFGDRDKELVTDPSQKLHPLRAIYNNIINGVQEAKAERMHGIAPKNNIENVLHGVKTAIDKIGNLIKPDVDRGS